MVAKARRWLKLFMASWKSLKVDWRRFWRSASPLVVDAHGTTAEDAQHQDGVAVAHAAGVLAAAHVEALVQSALDVPIAADLLQQLGTTGGVRFQAADIDDAFEAVLALVFAAQDGGLAGDFHHRAGAGAAERLGADRHPAQRTPLVARAVVLILADGGNARRRRQGGPGASPRGGMTAGRRSGRQAAARASSSGWLPLTGMR